MLQKNKETSLLSAQELLIAEVNGGTDKARPLVSVLKNTCNFDTDVPCQLIFLGWSSNQLYNFKLGTDHHRKFLGPRG